MRIGKEFTFDSAHFLTSVPEGHKCRGMHGHTYRLRVVIDGDIDERGFVIDFAELGEIVTPLVQLLDHKVINEVVPFETTAENLCQWFASKIQDELSVQFRVATVRLWETSNSFAEWVR
jgi:6-pyruvoyltetrahydropterin/6-carboxytetrahydropterin synthase